MLVIRNALSSDLVGPVRTSELFTIVIQQYPCVDNGVQTLSFKDEALLWDYCKRHHLVCEDSFVNVTRTRNKIAVERYYFVTSN